MDTISKKIIEIDNMYIIKVRNGYSNDSGSFIAHDEKGNDFFANKEIVERNPNLFYRLENNQESFWILVEERIWGEKWGNRKVQNIVTFSDIEEECQNFKYELFLQLFVISKLIEFQLLSFESNEYNSQIKILQKIVADLNSRNEYLKFTI
jgi:hypothetical protein